MDEATRFWTKVPSTHWGECWEWGGRVNSKGYGEFDTPVGSSPKTVRAHRWSWVFYNGPIPDDLHVLHKCDNPRCLNPNHLFLGTNKDNVADRHNKGRSRNKPTPGEKHNMAKLTEQQVLEIRKNSDTLQAELAKKFNISVPQVSRIINRKTWTHI